MKKMIQKKFKLKGEEIDYILEKGLETTSKLFIVRYGKNNRNCAGFCVIISRKISTKAVVRNKIRRRIYEAVREINKELQIKDLNIILIPKKSIINKEFSEIISDLRALTNKLMS